MRLVPVAVLALSVVLTATLPAHAETKRERAKRCATQGQIVGDAVMMRVGQASKTKTLENLTADYGPEQAVVVPMLVDYVYALDAADLTAAVAVAFEEQCNAFKP